MSIQVTLKGNEYWKFRCIESYQLIENELKHKPSQVIFTPILRERDPGNDLLKSYAEVYPL